MICYCMAFQRSPGCLSPQRLIQYKDNQHKIEQLETKHQSQTNPNDKLNYDLTQTLLSDQNEQRTLDFLGLNGISDEI